MLIVDFPATCALIKDRCVTPAKIARKYGLNETSFSKFLLGRFQGCSGQGVLGDIEAALIDMKLLVYEIVDDEQEAA
jgi:hypothetical protein